MTEKYLLPCACGAEHAVEARQAGQQIRCQCGMTLEIPTMQAITELQRTEAAQETRRSPSWGAPQRLILGGALVSAIGLAALAVLFWTRPKPPPVTELPPYESWIVWKQFRRGPSVPLEREQGFDETREIHRRWMAVAGVVVAIGLLTMFSAAMIPRKSEDKTPHSTAHGGGASSGGDGAGREANLRSTG